MATRRIVVAPVVRHMASLVHAYGGGRKVEPVARLTYKMVRSACYALEKGRQQARHVEALMDVAIPAVCRVITRWRKAA